MTFKGNSAAGKVMSILHTRVNNSKYTGSKKLSSLFSLNLILIEYETWGGLKEISYENPTNVWIGPSSHMLVQLGAMFPPCLRKDVLITLRSAKLYGHEASGLGCCEIAGSGAGKR